MDTAGVAVAFPNPLPLPSALDLLLDNNAVLAAYDVRDATTITRPSGGNPSAPTDTVGTLANLKTPGSFNFVAPASTNAPQWQSGALLFDGSDDRLEISTNPAATVDLICVYKGTQVRGCLWSTTAASSRYAGAWLDGNTSPSESGSGTPSYLVDGVPLTANQDALHAAIADGQAHVIEIRNVSLSLWVGIVFGTLKNLGSAYNINGRGLPVAVLNSGHADIAAGRTLAKDFADQLVSDLSL